MVQHRYRFSVSRRPSVSTTSSRLVLGVAAILILCAASASASTVTIKSGTKLMLDLSTPLNTATAHIDDEVWFTVRDDVRVDGVKALPRGTPVRGFVTAVRPAIVNGKSQRAEIHIRLEQIPLAEGGGFTIATSDLKVQGEKATGGTNTAQNAIGQATQGALLGGLITRSAKGAGIGAAAGVAIGVISGAVASKGSNSDV